MQRGPISRLLLRRKRRSIFQGAANQMFLHRQRNRSSPASFLGAILRLMRFQTSNFAHKLCVQNLRANFALLASVDFSKPISVRIIRPPTLGHVA